MFDCILIVVGVVVTLEVDGKDVSLPDPSGGEFNAAGDFDSLLPVDDLPMLSRIDPCGVGTFGSSGMEVLRTEAAELCGRVADGTERRGLMRLMVLAEHGSDLPGAVLRAVRD